LQLSGLDASPVRLVTEKTHFDLTLSITERRPGLIARLSYSTALFEGLTIERMLGHIRVLLQGAVAHPECRLSELPLLTREERSQLMQWNGVRVEYPRERCLYELFEAQAERLPEAVAVVHEGRQMTYRELNRRANQLGHYLRKRGIGPEVLVGIGMKRSVEMVVGLLGILKAGGAYVPLDVAYPTERLKYMIQDARITVLLTEQDLLEDTLDAKIGKGLETICLDRDWSLVSRERETNPLHLGTAETLAYVMYTSGSTGQPKGVGIPQRAVSRLVLETNYARFGEDEVFLQMAPTSFDASTFELWGALLNGFRCVLYPGGLPNLKTLGQQIEKHRVTTLWLTASLFNTVIDDAPEILIPIRQLLIGGEALSVAHVRQANEQLPNTQIINGYGPTENTTFTCCHTIPKVLESSRSIPIGTAIANTQVYLVDRYLNPVPVGVVGELYTGGDGLARGYCGRPDLTAERFIPNPFGQTEGERLYRTGDLARYLPDGNIEFLGRIDNQVKLRGFRIELGEIESALRRHGSVDQAVVICREDRGEKRLVAYFTVNGDETSIVELRNFLKNQVPEYMVPAVFVGLDKVPLTANGKVDRRSLPEPVGSEEPEGNGYCPPRDRLELQLTKIWESLLQVERVGVKDNFFGLGGHSLLATRLIARIEKTLGKRVSLASLFQSPTIVGIAKELREEASQLLVSSSQVKGSKRPEEQLIQPRRKAGQPVRLSFAQQRLWFLDQLLSGNSPYNVPTAVRLSGLLDVRCLEHSINAVIVRHEVLRTTIKSVQGKPHQIVADDRFLPLAIHDLSLRPEADKESETSQVLAEEAHRPFDLAQDLMLRATLIKLSEQEHILLLVMHHIASDGWSMGILMRELSHFYEAEMSGLPSSLPELPIQYADYAEWQLEWLQGEVLNKQVDYWKRQLAGAPPRLDLPTDHPRPAIQTFRGASRQMELSPELTQALKALSLREKASLFMTLLAAFQVLLFRYTRQDDIVVGSPIAGRNRGEVEGLIGFFVNTLVLRTDLSGDPTFVEVLRRVRSIALNAFEHQDLPFERLVEGLQSERSLSHNPIFQVMFAFQNAPGSPLQLSGLDASPVRLVTEKTHFDLTLAITERSPGLIARLSYSTDLFDEATIDRMAGHLEILLEGIVKEPEQRISRLPLLARKEWSQLSQWNDTGREYPRDRCLHELFEAQVERRPEAVAVVCEDRQLTYHELNRRANQLGHYLRKRGVGPEVRAGISLGRFEQMIVGLLGILKAGGAYVPLDLTYPSERLKYMIKDTGISLVLTEQDLLEGTLDLKIGNSLEAICLDRDWSLISRESDANPRHLGTPETLAYVMYTSGSTGQPKGIAITHQAVVRLVVNTDYVQIEPGDAVAQVSNSSFDAATFEIWGALLHGARLVGLPRDIVLSPEALGSSLAQCRISVLFLTTALFNQISRERPAAFATVRHLLFGGETVEPRCVQDVLREHPPGRLLHVYGPTETTTFASWYLVTPPLGQNRTIPIGRPIANTRIYILDHWLQPVPAGIAGELYVGGEGLARGYLNRPELTAEKFVPDATSRTPGERLYRTGDLARFLPDGNIEFIGRADNQVKIRGFRIELGEIEAALSRHPLVEQAVVTCREDRGEKRLVAYFTVHQGEISSNELRQFLKNQMPEYMVAAVFVRLDRLPLTANGKVDRRALPEPLGSEGSEGNGYCPPRDRLELQLTEIWESLLQVERVSVKDNFFDLGGHSLLAVKLLAHINHSLGRNLSVVSVFQAPTVEQMAQLVRQQGWKSPGESLVVVQPNGSKPPFFCVHGYAGYTGLVTHLGQDQPVYGLVQGLDGKRFYTRVEDLAAHYLRDVRSICPKGPYFLGGHSFGGLVAFEMAQQLRRAGDEVGLLALIDPTPPRHGDPRPAAHGSQRRRFSINNASSRILHHLGQLSKLPSGRRGPYIRERFSLTLTLLRKNGKRLRCEIYLRLERPMPPELRTFYIGEILFGEHYPAASRVYRAERYDGHAVLIHTGKRGGFDPETTWRELVPDHLINYLVSGEHLEILKDPLIGVVGGHLRICLQEAQGTRLATK